MSCAVTDQAIVAYIRACFDNAFGGHAGGKTPYSVMLTPVQTDRLRQMLEENAGDHDRARTRMIADTIADKAVRSFADLSRHPADAMVFDRNGALKAMETAIREAPADTEIKE